MNPLPVRARVRSTWRSALAWIARTDFRRVLRLDVLALLTSFAAAWGSIATVEQMRLERRAWLSVQNPELVGEFKHDEPVSYRIYLHNTGPSPGRIARVATKLLVVPPAHDLSVEFDDLVNRPEWGGVIPPDAAIRFDGTFSLDVHQFDFVTAGRLELYLLGEWHYHDGLESWLFKRTLRMTRFCLKLDPFASPRLFRFCGQHNSMN